MFAFNDNCDVTPSEFKFELIDLRFAVWATLMFGCTTCNLYGMVLRLHEYNVH